MQYVTFNRKGKPPLKRPQPQPPEPNISTTHNIQLLFLSWIIIGFLAKFTMVHYTSNYFANKETRTPLSSLDTISLNYNITSIDHTSGAIITGIDICNHMNDININSLINTVYKYKFIIFKNQCSVYNYKIPSNIFSKFVSKFGNLQPVQKIWISEAPNISVFSNNASIGHTGLLTSQWHIDQFHIPHPFCFQHMVQIPKYGYGGTDFIDAYSILQLFKKRNPIFYEQMHRLFVSYGREDIILPFIAIHPITKQEYINIVTPLDIWRIFEVIDTNINVQFVKNIKYAQFKRKYLNDNRFRFFSEQEIKIISKNFLKFMDNEVENNNNLVYSIQYEPGDLLMRDNLQIIHRANETSYFSVNEIGMRELWRITLLNDQYPIVPLSRM